MASKGAYMGPGSKATLKLMAFLCLKH